MYLNTTAPVSSPYVFAGVQKSPHLHTKKLVCPTFCDFTHKQHDPFFSDLCVILFYFICTKVFVERSKASEFCSFKMSCWNFWPNFPAAQTAFTLLWVLKSNFLMVESCFVWGFFLFFFPLLLLLPFLITQSEKARTNVAYEHQNYWCNWFLIDNLCFSISEEMRCVSASLSVLLPVDTIEKNALLGFKCHACEAHSWIRVAGPEHILK